MKKQLMIDNALFTFKQSLSALKVNLPLCVVFAIIFMNFPSIDLHASSLFFRSTLEGYTSGEAGFWLRNSNILWFIYAAVDVLGRVVLMSAIVLSFWFIINKNAQAFFAITVTIALLLAPLLAVNGIFKEHWGRARPRNIQQFHGEKQFTPAWVMTNQCEHNCAFTSGHAATGFALCIGYFVSRRKIWLKAGIVLGGLIGLTRMMNGAHFLSDVIFSYFIVIITSAAVAWVISYVAINVLAKERARALILSS